MGGISWGHTHLLVAASLQRAVLRWGFTSRNYFRRYVLGVVGWVLCNDTCLMFNFDLFVVATIYLGLLRRRKDIAMLKTQDERFQVGEE